MATKDTGQGASGLSRRDFLKASAAATAVVGCGLEFAYDPAKASAYEGLDTYTITSTTCPYCSASCGQRVVVANDTTTPNGAPLPGTKVPHPDTALRGKIVDMYGDFESPMNSGGLCSKGSGTFQLVTNKRRIGAWPGAHPVNNVFAADTTTYPDGVAYKRGGTGDANEAWTAMPLDDAMAEIAPLLKAARDTNWGGTTGASAYNSKGVAFFGSSHMNNESNYMYRKIIANFGSSNVEHQARI